MEKIFIDVGHLHFNNNLWLNELIYYKSEFNIYKKRVENIVTSRRSREDYVDILSLEKEYMHKKEEVEQLKEIINQAGHELASYDSNHLLAYGDDPYVQHMEIGRKVQTLREQYHFLKNQLAGLLKNFAYNDYELQSQMVSKN